MIRLIEIFIGITEVIIGISALIGVAIVQTTGIYGFSPKPVNVYVFVVVSACISFILGVGILSKREWARNLLVFFSGYVLITKILKYGGLLTFNSDIINAATAMPIWGKDAISFFYHSFVILFIALFKRKR
jgi:hypothetical protein